MAGNVFALLVGINQYDPSSSVPALQGCSNDVKAMAAYLQGRVAQDKGSFQLQSLLNEQATRQAVIDGFRSHLCQAGPDDVALFFYAGHGAQENAPEEFWHLEPDYMNETLVCYDSRCKGSWDLADKELSKLIAEVATKNPHIVVILDCCHSGAGTRGTLESTESVRRAPVDSRKRPLESFIVSPSELPVPSTRSIDTPNSGWQVPQGRHVLLAACRDIEEAKEISGRGEHRGAFAYFLLESLQNTNGRLTYRDIFKRTSGLVKSRVAAQTPQLEANISDDLDQPFLGGVIQPRAPHFNVSHNREHGWIIDGGYIHGIANPKAGETTLLALFTFDSSDEALQEGTQAIGTASITAVMPGISQVKIQCITDLQPDMVFKAVVTAMPLPPMGVLINGEATGADLLQQALESANGIEQSSLYVRKVDSPVEATFQVLCQDGEYRVKRSTDDRILVAPLSGYSVANAEVVVNQLERLARWTQTLELESAPTSRIPMNAVQLEITHNAEVVNNEQI